MDKVYFLATRWRLHSSPAREGLDSMAGPASYRRQILRPSDASVPAAAGDEPGPATAGPRADAATTFRRILRAGEYQALWLGQAQSIAGDQLARLALAVLVYDRTRSPLLTAITYAGSFLPWLAGGLVLAPLADRWPRRTVLVTCDMARGALVAAIAVPGMPLPVMVALLYLVALLDGPFYAARSGTYRDILPDDRYRLGVTIASTTSQAALVAGFAAGGILVAAAGARPALLIDAATYGISALLIRRAVAPRPAAAAAGLPVTVRVAAGLRLAFAGRLRTCMLFGWLSALYSVPSALAVPLAASLKGGPGTAGLLFAAAPLGAAAGTAVYGRGVGAARQARWMGPLAVLCCSVLALFLARPDRAWALVILTGSGALGCYQVTANTSFVQGLRRDQQAPAFGIATAGIWTIQGLAYLAAGAIAEIVPPATVVAGSGIAGAAAAIVLTVSWTRQDQPAAPDSRPPGRDLPGRPTPPGQRAN